MTNTVQMYHVQSVLDVPTRYLGCTATHVERQHVIGPCVYDCTFPLVTYIYVIANESVTDWRAFL